MAVSLFDHERRLHDLEAGLRAEIDLLIIETPLTRDALEQAARTLHVRGQEGAARLLLGSALRVRAR